MSAVILDFLPPTLRLPFPDTAASAIHNADLPIIFFYSTIATEKHANTQVCETVFWSTVSFGELLLAAQLSPELSP